MAGILVGTNIGLDKKKMVQKKNEKKKHLVHISQRRRVVSSEVEGDQEVGTGGAVEV